MPLLKALDRLVDIVAEPVFPEQDLGALAPDLEGKAAERAHEGDRLARRHRGIEAALLGQIADDLRRLERPLMAEQRATPGVRLDDSEQHPEGGGFARAVGAQYAVYTSLGDREINAADGRFAVESLDEALCLNS